MAEDVKPDKTPATDGAGQLSQQQLDAIVAKVTEALDRRVSGLQSAFDKKVKELREDLESPDNDVVSDPQSRVSPSDRASRRAAADSHDREVSLNRREIALEFGVKPDDVSGDTPDQMRINLLTKALMAKVEVKPAVEKSQEVSTAVGKPFGAFTPLAAGGNSVTSPGGNTPEGMLQKGLADHLKSLNK